MSLLLLFRPLGVSTPPPPTPTVTVDTGAAGNWTLNKLGFRRAKNLRELQAQWKQVRQVAKKENIEIPEVKLPVIEFDSSKDQALAEILRQRLNLEHEIYLRKLETQLLDSVNYLREQIISQEDEELITIIMMYMTKRGRVH